MASFIFIDSFSKVSVRSYSSPYEYPPYLPKVFGHLNSLPYRNYPKYGKTLSTDHNFALKFEIVHSTISMYLKYCCMYRKQV